MIKLTYAALLFLFSTSLAHAALPLGDFGHEFTQSRNDKVFTVAPSGKAYSVTYHGDGTRKPMDVWSAGQRRAFWERMQWKDAAHASAECIGTSDEVFCFLPAASRKQSDFFTDYASDFFHYDTVGGFMEIRPLGKVAPRKK